MTLEELIIGGVGLIIATAVTTLVTIFVKDRFSKKTVYRDDIPDIVNNILAIKYTAGELVRGIDFDGFRKSMEKECTTKLDVEAACKEVYKMSMKYTDSHIGALHDDHRALHDDINTKFSEVHTKIEEASNKSDKKIDELKTLIITELAKKGSS